MDAATVDITNGQAVGVQGDWIRVLLPVTALSKESAVVHAAWLVALSGVSDEDFLTVLRRIEAT